MALNVISNFAANVAHRNLTMSDAAATSSLTKLSSGQRVVSAKDDAASLAIGSRLRAEVVAMKTASVNAGQAGSMLQIADGAMATISDILVRMKELAVQSSSGQFSSTERTILDSEFQALKNEITRISDDTEFNGTQLIAGGATTTAALVSLNDATSKVDSTVDGFTSFTFDKSVSDKLFEVTYNATNDTMTVTDTIGGTVESVILDVATIQAQAAGASTNVSFSTLGLTVSLNNGFNDTDITTTATAATAADAFATDTSGAMVIGTGITISAIDIQSTDGYDIGDGATALNLTIAAGSGAGADATVTIVGTGGTFTGTLKTDATGSQSIVLTRTGGVDTDGNSVNDTITLDINVTAVSDADDDDAVTRSLTNLFNVVMADQVGDATKTTFTFKVGTGNQSYDSLSFDVNAASASALSLNTNTIDTAANAETASTAVSAAIDTLNQSRSTVGAAQNRLTFATNNLASAIENAEAARSNLLDLDVAKEISVFTSKQVLVQTGVAMLAQANQMPQNLLRLFQ